MFPAQWWPVLKRKIFVRFYRLPEQSLSSLEVQRGDEEDTPMIQLPTNSMAWILIDFHPEKR